MKRAGFLIRGSCLILMSAVLLAVTGCEKRKKVPEDMTLGDEYLEKIVMASDIEERDFEEDGTKYHEFKTKKMVITYPLLEKEPVEKTEVSKISFSVKNSESYFYGERSFDYKKRKCWYKYVALPELRREDNMVKREYSLYNARGFMKVIGDSFQDTAEKIGNPQTDVLVVNGADKQVIEAGDNHRPIIVLFGDDNFNAITYNSMKTKFCKELNKAVIREDTTYKDGTVNTKYYSIQTYNNNNYSQYTFYELKFD